MIYDTEDEAEIESYAEKFRYHFPGLSQESIEKIVALAIEESSGYLRSRLTPCFLSYISDNPKAKRAIAARVGGLRKY